MSADVHPAGTGPLPVAAGTAGPLVAFTERTGLDPATGRLVMYLRVVQIDGDPAAPPPGLGLAAGAGPASDVGTASTPVADGPGAPVALATRTDEADALTLVEVEVLQPGRPWQLQIVNRDSQHHRYVWVVADTDDGTRQPWLDLPTAAVALEVTVGETSPPQDLPVANHGPGPLRLDEPDGTDLGAGFSLLSVTPRPIGANRTGTARVVFAVPAQPGQPATDHTFASNDPGAGAVAGHRNRVALTATVRLAPRWVAGDILMLGESTLGRLDRATGRPVPVTTETAGAVDVVVDPTTGDAVLLGNGFVKRVNRFTGVQTALPGFSSLTRPVGVAVDRDGTVIVVDKEPASMVRLTRDGVRDVVAFTMSALISAPMLDGAHDAAPEDTGDVVACGEFSPLATAPQPMAVRLTRSGSVDMIIGGIPINSTEGAQAVAIERDGTVIAACRARAAAGGSTVPVGRLIRSTPGPLAHRVFLESRDLRDPTALAVAADGTILVGAGPGLFAVHPQSGALTRLSDVSGARIAVVPPLGTP
jgi:hypothetical protein